MNSTRQQEEETIVEEASEADARLPDETGIIETRDRRHVAPPELALNSPGPSAISLQNEGGGGEDELQKIVEMARNTGVVVMPKQAKKDAKDKPKLEEMSLDEDEFVECKYTSGKKHKCI